MEIKLYCAEWCGSCHRVKHFFDRNKVVYEYIDIDMNPEAEAYIIDINPNGYRSIPVVKITDKEGSEDLLIEPSQIDLEEIFKQ